MGEVGFRYAQAERVEEELEKMGERIRETISVLNQGQGVGEGKGSSPLEVVHCVLNNQLTALMGIDKQVRREEEGTAWGEEGMG